MIKTRKHHSTYFILYKELSRQRDNILMNRPKGRFGVSYANDLSAVIWRETTMRHEILLAYLENRYPNWHKAHWLSFEEAERRNQ